MSISLYKQHPFVRILLPLIAGIVFRYNFNWPLQFSLGMLVVFGVSFYGLYPFSLNYRWNYLKGILVTGIIFAVGVVLTGYHLANKLESTGNSKDTVWFIGTLSNIPIENENNMKATFQVQAQMIGSEWKEQSATLVVIFEKDSNSMGLLAGQQLLFKTKINKSLQGTNPFGFDYQRYLNLKQIEGTVFLKSNDWKVIVSEPSGLVQQALNIRSYLLSIFEKAGIHGDELSVLSALTLGYRDKMDAAIKNAYQGAGATHILSVSGMHVGIIYIIIGFVLSWMNYFSNKPRLKYLVIILALWGYSLLTGLPPSVCRASTMFTFVLIGKLLDKRINFYNSLTASAFFLLLINPLWLFDIGFQLSYIAVAGLVFFQPKIYNLWYIKNKAGDYLWSLTAVSLAAQLVTTPLSIFYFHQFPVYFWLSNIVVVIAASILIFLALLLLAVSKISFLVTGIGVLLKYLLIITNGFVEWINTLPFSRITNIPLNGFTMFLLYVLIAFITAWLLTKNYRYIVSFLAVLLLYSAISMVGKINRNNNASVCVYQANQQSAIQFVSGNYSWWFTSKTADSGSYLAKLIADANFYWRTNNNKYFLLSQGDTSFIDGPLFYNSGFWKFENSNGLIVADKVPGYFSVADSLSLDILMVTGNPSIGKKELAKELSLSNVIIDGSVPVWNYHKWDQNIDQAKVVKTRENGAFMYPLH